MANVPPEFEITDVQGSTDEYTGSVGTSAVLVPGTAGNVIEEISIRCTVDQEPNKRLEFSFNGTNYFRLRVGESREEEPRGGIKQVYIRAAGTGVSSVNYEIVMNRGTT